MFTLTNTKYASTKVLIMLVKLITYRYKLDMLSQLQTRQNYYHAIYMNWIYYDLNYIL